MAGRELACSVSGHFGELLQGRLGACGPVVLVTLPAPGLRVTAHHAPAGPFAVYGPRLLAPSQAAALCRAVAGRPPRGRLRLASGMPPGGGAGSSTAALLAAAGAFAAARGQALPAPEQLAAICVRLEGATDPLMHAAPERLLWMPRAGRALAVLPALPALEVVGGFVGPGQRTDPTDGDFADVADLVADWPSAAARGDLPGLAALATESARRNVRRRGGDIAGLEEAAARTGALGVVVAHTGSARGLLFAPGRGCPQTAAAALRGLGAKSICRYRFGW